MNERVLIFGIDGGTWSVLQPAMDQGYMPFLKSMVASGASGILESTLPAITPAAWGTFQTGVNPSANGVFDFAYWDKKTKESHYVTSRTLKPTLWEFASQAGKRVAIINVPMTYPPRAINGYTITGILTPSLKSDFTYPSSFKEELMQAVPNYHIFNLSNIQSFINNKDIIEFVQLMTDSIQNRAQAAQYLIAKEPFDLFMIQFQATDILQHAMWGYLDINHPDYDSSKHEYILKTFYQTLDLLMANLYKNFAKQMSIETTTLIVSDHGFEHHRKRFNLGNWLCRKGLLTPINHKPSIMKRLTRKLGVGKLLKTFLSHSAVDDLERIVKFKKEGYAWQSSKAYAFGRSGEGFIYLLEDDDAHRKKTKECIRNALSKEMDPETNKPIVSSIYDKQELYQGEYRDRFPDLIIEPSSGLSFTGNVLPDNNLYDPILPQKDLHIGKHHKNGIMVISGPQIQSSHTLHAHLQDIVPTLLYLFGLPIPQHLDGRIIQDLFTQKFTNDNKPNYIASELQKDYRSDQPSHSEDEEKEIRDRLKHLGYM